MASPCSRRSISSSRARPAGEAVYALVRHDDHVHAAYVLELPAQPGDVQHALGIEREASYVAQVRNPEDRTPTRWDSGERGRVTLPPDLQRRFGRRRFIPLDPPSFLDHEGVELLLIGASPDIEAELGLSLDAERETEASAEIFRDLRLERDLHPTAPLFEGRWE